MMIGFMSSRRPKVHLVDFCLIQRVEYQGRNALRNFKVSLGLWNENEEVQNVYYVLIMVVAAPKQKNHVVLSMQ
jgi:hypothetical protein